MLGGQGKAAGGKRPTGAGCAGRPVVGGQEYAVGASGGRPAFRAVGTFDRNIVAPSRPKSGANAPSNEQLQDPIIRGKNHTTPASPESHPFFSANPDTCGTSEINNIEYPGNSCDGLVMTYNPL